MRRVTMATGGTTGKGSGAVAVGVSRKTRIAILASDAVVLVATTLLAFSIRFPAEDLDVALIGPIQLVGTVAPLLWIVVLILVGSYEQRVVGLGLTEYGRVVQSALWMVGLVSVVSFLGKFDTSRAYVLLVIPIGLVGLLIERWIWRRWILARRKHGRDLQTTLVVGNEHDQQHVSDAFADRPWAGYRVAATMNALAENGSSTERGVWFDQLMDTIHNKNISCIALTGSCGLNGSDIREVSWRIEGKGIDLLLSSSLGAVSGPRVSMRVATGLPFVHLDEVGLGLSQRALKRMLDIVGSFLALIVLSPVLLVIALLVLLTSGRPVFFGQPRAGVRAEMFTMWKFRTMVPDADARKEELRQLSALDEPMVKIPDDPRVTPIGKFLRRWSLDELPQLWNVLTGDMSLVGPRPHPLDDVERYRDTDSRRLLAKPGMTGLWQVAGRSDLSWEDAVELDLLYIENWSWLSDLAILARTIQAVISRSGAY